MTRKHGKQAPSGHAAAHGELGHKGSQNSIPAEDVMPGRSFAGASYAANEGEQTRERERVAEESRLDEAGEPEVTEAEIEAREAQSDDDSP